MNNNHERNLIIWAILNICEVMFLNVQNNVLLQHLKWTFNSVSGFHIFYHKTSWSTAFQKHKDWPMTMHIRVIVLTESSTFSMALPSLVVEYLNMSSFTTFKLNIRYLNWACPLYWTLNIENWTFELSLTFKLNIEHWTLNIEHFFFHHP